MMKNLLSYSLFILSILFVSCSSSDVDVELDPVVEAETAEECESTHPLVGQSRAFRVSSIYGISGNVTIVSDCQIRLTNFNYNGTGPAVAIWAADDADWLNGTNISAPIQGTSFANATVDLFLPEGSTLDDFNSFSVWCFQFDIDFSSANFN